MHRGISILAISNLARLISQGLCIRRFVLGVPDGINTKLSSLPVHCFCRGYRQPDVDDPRDD